MACERGRGPAARIATRTIHSRCAHALNSCAQRPRRPPHAQFRGICGLSRAARRSRASTSASVRYGRQTVAGAARSSPLDSLSIAAAQLPEESLPPAVNPDLAHIWPAIQSELKRAVPEHTYDLWLAPLRPVAIDGDTVDVVAPEGMRPRIADRFGRVLQSCAAAVLGPATQVDVIAPGDVPRETRGGGQPEPLAPAGDGINQSLTFESFVIGDTNRFAHAAALSVAESPGQAYNPLFIYGPPGVGKTHLLHAIGNYTRAFGSGLTVHYTTAETFTSDFITAVQGDGIGAFKGRYRANDLLLIDDIQFLESKARTEEEFFHTFNSLHDAGAQIVVTCDRPPDDLS